MEVRVGPVQRLHHGAIVMRVIVGHTTFQDAARAGLFGLLGDAPIQIVDMSDELRLDAFFILQINASLVPSDPSHRGKTFIETLRSRSRPPWGKSSPNDLEHKHYLRSIPRSCLGFALVGATIPLSCQRT